MNLHQAEKITGLEIVRVISPTEGKRRTYAACDGKDVIATATGHDDRSAVQMLVYRVYESRSLQTRREQAHRCFSCFGILPLEIDHIIMRSDKIHGRDDRRTNLRALCCECHRKRHDSWHPVEPVPHEKILPLMVKVGLAWVGSGWENRDGRQSVLPEPGGGPLQVRSGVQDPEQDGRGDRSA